MSLIWETVSRPHLWVCAQPVISQALAVECFKWREIAKNEKNVYVLPYVFFSFLAISRHFKHLTASACGYKCYQCMYFLVYNNYVQTENEQVTRIVTFMECFSLSNSYWFACKNISAMCIGYFSLDKNNCNVPFKMCKLPTRASGSVL